MSDPEPPTQNLFVTTGGAAIVDLAEVAAIENRSIGVAYRVTFVLRSGVKIHSWHRSMSDADAEQFEAAARMQGKPPDPISPPPDPSLN